MPTLVARSGPLAGRRFELGEDEVILGRENATITLADEETSRRHAAIRVVGGRVVIEDLGSTNGTFVDGERISAATELLAGTTVKLGHSVFSVELTPAPDAQATRLAPRPDAAADPDATALRARPPRAAPPPDPDRTELRPRPAAPSPADPDPDRTELRRRPRTPADAPREAAPAPRGPPRRAPEPALAPAASADPLGAFAPPAPKRRRGAASLQLAPTLLSFATIILTAAALVVYFAGR